MLAFKGTKRVLDLWLAVGAAAVVLAGPIASAQDIELEAQLRIRELEVEQRIHDEYQNALSLSLEPGSQLLYEVSRRMTVRGKQIHDITGTLALTVPQGLARPPASVTATLTVLAVDSDNIGKKALDGLPWSATGEVALSDDGSWAISTASVVCDAEVEKLVKELMKRSVFACLPPLPRREQGAGVWLPMRWRAPVPTKEGFAEFISEPRRGGGLIVGLAPGGFGERNIGAFHATMLVVHGKVVDGQCVELRFSSAEPVSLDVTSVSMRPSIDVQ